MGYFSGQFSNDNVYFLMSRLIKNNKKILFDQELSKKILGRLVGQLEELGSSDIRKSFVFHLITLLTSYHNKAIRRNQNMIFDYFIKNGENWLYSNLKRMRFIAFIRNYSSFYYDSRKHNIPKDTKFVALPAKLCTIISIIQLVNQCNKGGNSFVTSISEKIISLEHIKKLLEQRLPIPIKIVFLNYIKRIYLDNIDELEEYEFNEYFALFESL